MKCSFLVKLQEIHSIMLFIVKQSDTYSTAANVIKKYSCNSGEWRLLKNSQQRKQILFNLTTKTIMLSFLDLRRQYTRFSCLQNDLKRGKSTRRIFCNIFQLDCMIVVRESFNSKLIQFMLATMRTELFLTSATSFKSRPLERRFFQNVTSPFQQIINIS